MEPNRRPLGTIPLEAVPVPPSENPALDTIKVVLGSIGGAATCIAIPLFFTWWAWVGTKEARTHSVLGLEPAVLWLAATLGVIIGAILMEHINRFERWKRVAKLRAEEAAAKVRDQKWYVAMVRYEDSHHTVWFSSEDGYLHNAYLPSSYTYDLGSAPTIVFKKVTPRLPKFLIRRGHLELRGDPKLILPDGSSLSRFTAAHCLAAMMSQQPAG
jgi:hypothetical protein